MSEENAVDVTGAESAVVAEQTSGEGTAEAARPKPRIHRYLEAVVKFEASDLHLKVDVPPRIRLSGNLRSLNTRPPANDEMNGMIREILDEDQWHDLHHRGSLDIAYAINTVDRFRMNIFKQRGQISLAARRINPKIPNYQQLNLPPIFSKVADTEQGLVLMAGITGSGKSTTIAAMVEQINHAKPVHIVTIEDPIEYSYTDKKALINQREIGLDCESYESGIRALMREDPDVIVIGEMRDRHTFQAAIQAAETGHLVFSTIHASSAPGAITRILELFPKEMHTNMRQALAANLVAVAFQKLLPALDPNVKRVPCVEMMLNSPAVKKYILEEREHELISVIRNEKGTGMIDFNEMLADMVQKEVVSNKEAMAASPNADELRMRMKGIRTS